MASVIKSPVTDGIKAPTKSSVQPRQFRDAVTRVGITTRPIKGEDTQAKQSNRWTP